MKITLFGLRVGGGIIACLWLCTYCAIAASHNYPTDATHITQWLSVPIIYIAILILTLIFPPIKKAYMKKKAKETYVTDDDIERVDFDLLYNKQQRLLEEVDKVSKMMACFHEYYCYTGDPNKWSTPLVEIRCKHCGYIKKVSYEAYVALFKKGNKNV